MASSSRFSNQPTLIPKLSFNKINTLSFHHISSTTNFHYTNSITKKISLNYKHNNKFQLICFSQHNTHNSFLTKTFILLTFSCTLLSLRIISTNILLPNFPQRWTQLITFSKQAANSELMINCPKYLIKAVVAYEDKRFFQHFGIDPVGVARAVISLSSLGGGSTITQQLVKNSFLKNERTFLRKFVEMILALALDGTISKSEILSAYLCKIYWGHGIYGVQSASQFYFGKHVSLLSLGECAMLAAMIPAPELRSPFRDSTRGKVFQARVLKRMVEFGFLDVEMARIAVKQPLILNSGSPDHSDRLLVVSSSSQEHPGIKTESIKRIWDWETESKVWEIQEEVERWATGVKKFNGSQFKITTTTTATTHNNISSVIPQVESAEGEV